MQPVRVHARKSRPLGVREVQTIEYRLYRTIEPKQRGAGARVSSDARRVCDASGQEEGPRSVALRGGRGGLTKQVSQSVMRFYRSLLYISKIFYLPKFFIHPLPPRSHTLRGPSFPCGDGFSTHPSCSTIPSGKHAFSIQKS